MILNQLDKAHSGPMPNGYGTVKLPHLRKQPGLVVFAVASMLAGRREVLVPTAADPIDRRSKR